MHLFKSTGLEGSPRAIHVGGRLIVSPAVHHLIVMAETDKEVKQIMGKLEIIDVDKIQIPAFTKKEE